MERATTICLVLVQLNALRKKVPLDVGKNDVDIPQGRRLA